MNPLIELRPATGLRVGFPVNDSLPALPQLEHRRPGLPLKRIVASDAQFGQYFIPNEVLPRRTVGMMAGDAGQHAAVNRRQIVRYARTSAAGKDTHGVGCPECPFRMAGQADLDGQFLRIP